ncbi:FadR/GntR family transcriptional regulator [Rubrobacter calidifluminis]|uniref:FadR/GntR family transcriptional regulator n=1 Tax=Rubrobacter calidifluminis TaxID=1392640 RepID=UPI002362F5EE|nr:FadR/GntR family transcriptional regulator [Rubrobacter calidifluminis]
MSGDVEGVNQTTAPAKRRKLYIEIAARIRDSILSGELKPGQPLPPERKLAEQFDVGRAVIREAIRQLEAAGLVESRHGGGNFVREITTEHLVAPIARILRSRAQLREELMDARLFFEPQIARKAADRATEEDLRSLEEILARQEEKVRKGEPTADEDAEFHSLLAQATHNTVIEQILEIINDLLEKAYERPFSDGERSKHSLQGNREVFEAVRRRDRDAAQRAMARHIEDVARSFRPKLDPGERT